MNDTLEARVKALEATAFRHGDHLDRLGAAVETISGKLDDLSGQVRELRLGQVELGDRLTVVEQRLIALDERMGVVESLLQRVVAKLGA